MENLVFNVKAFEKYTSQFWLLKDSNCSKNIRYYISTTNVNFPRVFHGPHSHAASFSRNRCPLTGFFAKKRFKTKKVNIFWNFIINKVKVMLDTFLNFVYGSFYLGTKRNISFEPQMVRSSYKDHLSKLFLRSTKLKYWLS